MKSKKFQLIMVFMAIAALLAFSYNPAMAQDGIAGDEVDEALPGDVDRDTELEWGQSDFITQSVPTWAFQGYNASYDNQLQALANNRYCSGSCVLEAPTFLPTGVRITAWELNAWDSSGGSVSLALYRCPINSTGCSALGSATVTPGAGGYYFISRGVSHTVDNWNNSYVFECRLNGGGSSYRIVGARVLYRLQISPAPAFPTFNDVFPYNWYYQSVEALADSGITVGCGGGSYCPNNFVTRAEMAAFLARALGLHYPR